MGLIQIDHNPPRRQLNLFGAIWLVFFGVVGGVVFRQGGSAEAAGVVWAAAVAVPAVGWIAPGFMRVVYLGMAYAAFPIGLVVSYVIMLVVYYLLLTPMGLVMRLLGYDPMDRRFDRGAATYWRPRETDDRASRYFRQF